MRCLYVGTDVWWPQRTRARCTRSSRGKCCSSVGSMGEGWVPSSVFGSALSSVLWVYVVCMWVRRDVLSESGGKESNSLWYSWVTFRCGGQVAVCEPEMIEGGVMGDWGVLLRCRCEFL